MKVLEEGEITLINCDFIIALEIVNIAGETFGFLVSHLSVWIFAFTYICVCGRFRYYCG